MDHKESALLDSLLSSRTLNPDKAVFPLHFASAEGDLGTIKKLLEKSHAESKEIQVLMEQTNTLVWAL